MNDITFPRWDTELFIKINGLHADWLDPVMTALSSVSLWIPLYSALAFFMFRKGKVEGIIAVLCIILGFTLADQLSVILFKNTFRRLRPCYIEDLSNIIRSLEGCGGRYGFISNHAANTFCLAAFTAFLFGNKVFSASIFLWASAVSYSRIYVGKHYPLDVICGALFGAICGLSVYLLYKYAIKIRLKRRYKDKSRFTDPSSRLA